MVARATVSLENVRITTETVAASQTATKGMGLVWSSGNVDDAGANGNCMGVALETKAAGEKVQVAHLNGGGVVPVLVGTGGATQGAYATMASDGWTNQTLGGGTTVSYIGGKFVETGVVGDIVGLEVGQFAGVKA